jgi:hypothetical protein
MAKQKEAVFAEAIDKDLRREFGRDIFIENIQQKSKKGTPDRLICLKGKFVALELKVDGGSATEIQIKKLLEINVAGGKGFIVYPHTWPLVLEELRKLSLS